MAGGTDDAAGGLNSLGLAVELIAEALDVIQAVGNDNVVTGEHALDGRVLLGTSILLCLGRVIYPTGQAKRLVVDKVDLEPAGARIGVLAGDLGLEKLLQLEGTGGLASRGVARDDQELGRYQRAGTGESISARVLLTGMVPVWDGEGYGLLQWLHDDYFASLASRRCRKSEGVPENNCPYRLTAEA